MKYDPEVFEVCEGPAWAAFDNASVIVLGDALMEYSHLKTPGEIREFGLARAVEFFHDFPGFREQVKRSLDRYLEFSRQLLLRMPTSNK